MKFKLILLVCLALSTSAARLRAQESRMEGAQSIKAEADTDPTTGLRQRLVKLKPQLKELRAKPRALKPGDSVELNPQPEPPGKTRSHKINNRGDTVSLNPQPEPPGSVGDILRQMRASLASIEADLGKLSLNPDAGVKFNDRLKDARAALNGYEQAGDQKSANAALDGFSHALDALSKLTESYVK